MINNRNIIGQTQPTYYGVDDLFVEFLILAGGGGGGAGQAVLLENNPGGAGGGAGGLITGSGFVRYNYLYQGSIGAGGNGGEKTSSAPGNNGSNTTFFGLTTLGGGGGGASNAGSVPECTNYNGKSGGSGGGAGNHLYYSNNCQTGSALQPISSWGGFGNPGAEAVGTFAGAGGGAGGTGSLQTGGPGITWLDGITYGVGGNAAQSSTNNTASGSGGFGGEYDDSGNSGTPGIVVVRYEGSPKSTNGNVVEAGGYTYHYFNRVAGANFVFRYNSGINP